MTDALRRAAAWATVGALARLLEGVAPIAPLKGAVLEMGASPGRAARMADVDVLVPEEAYEAAHAALSAAGVRCVARDRDDRARTYTGGLPATVDLHRRLFKTGLFRVPTRDLFARATRDEETYGAPLWLLDPRDTYAHLLGHAVAGRHSPAGRRKARRDLAEWAAHAELAPARVARHLDHLGMGRAARLVLSEAEPEDGFSRAVLAGLRGDPLGAALANTAGWAIEPGRGPLLQTLGVHALNATLPRGAFSLASHLLRGAHQRWIDRDPPGIAVDP